ncbi:CPCC family cysteine-rich protein [Streptomyces sp. NPDC002536]
MHLAPWVFPIDYSGRKPWTWWNPRLLLMLLMGPALVIGALNPLVSVPWRERLLFGLAGVVITTLLALCITGYRRLAAFVDDEEHRAVGEPTAAASAESAPGQAPPGGWLPCPCCGHQMFGELWSDEICSVCFWQENPYQLRYPWAEAGPNGGLSLMEAQANYRKFGAMEERHRRHVRPPTNDEPLDPGWRPVDVSRDPFEPGPSSVPMPEDLTSLYWWRPNYWRRDESPTAS